MREVKKFVRQRLLAKPRHLRKTGTNQKKQDTVANLIVVSHEATLTGAPKIILRLLAELSKSPKIACRSLIHNEGSLLHDFRKHADVYLLDTKRKLVPRIARMVKHSIQTVDLSKPTIALVNSAESRFIAKSIADAGIPIVSLIHELPNSYDVEDFRLIDSTSTRVVFPSTFVSDAVHRFVDMAQEKTQILSQGLLDDQFGTRVDRASAKNDLELELGIPSTAKVVLGCGTVDLRKGIDHFASAARALIRNHAAGEEAHFVWLGGGPRHRHSPFHYVNMDLQRSGIEDRVHFVGERADVEPYFMAADAALMMSREDPFPCVVHEAMACGIPMISFANAGGAPEALAEESGIVVPYGDTDAVGRELHRLFSDREHSRRISRRAIQRVRSVYSFSRYAAQVGELLQLTAGVDMGFASTPQLRAAA